MQTDAPEAMTDTQKRILLVVLVPLFMSLLSVSIVNVVLPALQGSLGASTTALQWVLTGYTLSFGMVLVAAGRAGDLFGPGRIFFVGLVLFALGSLGAGLAPDPLFLNIARVVMGFGSGLLSPPTVGLIQQYFRGGQRARAFGAFGSVVGVSVAIGPVLGGVFIALLGDAWGWRVAFLVNVPIAIAAMITAFVWFPRSAWFPFPSETPGGQAVAPTAGATEAGAGGTAGARGTSAGSGASAAASGRKARPDFDPIGTVILAAATLAVMMPFLERSAGAWIYALLPVGVVLVVVWVWWESRYKRRGGTPMVDLVLFRTRSFANGSLLVALYFMGATSIWVILALYMQSGHGMSALAVGLIGLPSAIASAVSAMASGRYVMRIGRPLVLLGVVVAVLGMASSILVVVLFEHGRASIWWLLLTLTFIGLAQGMVISPNQTLTLVKVPIAYAGSAGGIMQTGQRVGTAIGIAVISALFFVVQEHAGWGAGIVYAYVAVAAIMILAGIVGFVDWRQGRRADH